MNNNISADPGAGFIVELIKTADMSDGQPLPPYFDDDGAIWRVVRHRLRSHVMASRSAFFETS